MTTLIKKKVKDVYGETWNKVAHRLGKQPFKIVGHIDGYILLFGEEESIKNFIDEVDKEVMKSL